jgi:SnoaL-like domain
MVRGLMGKKTMTESTAATNRIAEKIGPALEAADLSEFRDLLDPNVHWGPPGDPSPPCRNRDQVLSWYRRGKEAGRRAEVTEVVVHDHHIIVGLKVINTSDTTSHRKIRWQVLTVAGGRVTHIVGFDRRVDATTYAELP